MIYTHSRIALYIMTFILILIIPVAFAAMPENMYRDALQKAQDKALRTKQSQANALSVSAVKSLYGKYYQIGDEWNVAAWQFEHALTPLKRTHSSEQVKIGQGGLFHYEVVHLKSGFSPEITLKITQLPNPPYQIIDSRIASLHLVLSDSFSQTQKSYQIANTLEIVPAFSNGIRTQISTLEMFPLDVPDIKSAERRPISHFPLFPKELSKFAERVFAHINPEDCSWFEQDDFFGRPVQILWKQGDPWPTYIRTPQGIALLVGKEGLK